MSRAITDVKGLVESGLADAGAAASLQEIVDDFSLRITQDVVSQIRDANQRDPVYAQYVPDLREAVVLHDEMHDPIGDNAHQKVKGLVHRYSDRVLLKPTHTCQVYCRFCFRREKVGDADEALDEAELAAAVDYIRGHPEVWEVILSGGDPLVLSNRRLGNLIGEIAAIGHVKVIRLHTRVPLVDPKRINAELIAALKAGPAVYVVVHVNHANELSDEVVRALARFTDTGIPLLAQTVLLKGINNDIESLSALMRQLVEIRVKPYYLHHLDKARGTSHFRCSIAEGQALARGLRARLSGLCQPSYVLDIPGGHGKVPLDLGYLTAGESGAYVVKDRHDGAHHYRDLAE
jgi:lysine 2,3-aminomutase